MMIDLERQLSVAVETYKEQYIGLLADLVRCPSTLGNELPEQQRLLARNRSEPISDRTEEQVIGDELGERR